MTRANESSAVVRVLFAAGASAVAHVVLVGAALALAGPSGSGAPFRPVAIEILTSPEPEAPSEDPVVAPPDREHTAAPEMAPRRDEDVRPVPRRDAREQSNAEPSEVSVAPSIMVPEVQLEPQVSPRDAEAERRRLAIMLAPGRVARESFSFEGNGPSMPGPPAGRTLDDGRPTERELEASLGGSLREEAMTKRHITRTRPQFRRQTDGTYVYSGHLTTATISRCGELSFAAQPGINTNGISASGSFDLEGALMRAQGQNPNAAEESWISEHSEELRDQLDATCRREQMAQALRRLRGRLASVWAAESRTEAARRARLFGIWDDMEEGEAGNEPRSIVIEFIRATIPLGDEHAYTTAEIERFNARRTTQSVRFEPY